MTNLWHNLHKFCSEKGFTSYHILVVTNKIIEGHIISNKIFSDKKN